MDLKALYHEVLADHSRYPGHFGRLEDANLTKEGVNPSCGDDYTLELKLSPEGSITDGAFTGEGCAISKASLDMMLDLVIGKTEEEALSLDDVFRRMLRGETKEGETDRLEEAAMLESLSHLPARTACALLGWNTLRRMLEERKHINQ